MAVTYLSMRATYAGLPPDATRAIVGENGVAVYGLDGGALKKVAAGINAPTLKGLSELYEESPAHWTMAFRKEGPYT